MLALGSGSLCSRMRAIVKPQGRVVTCLFVIGSSRVQAIEVVGVLARYLVVLV
jgi:hypothetical protein